LSPSKGRNNLDSFDTSKYAISLILSATSVVLPPQRSNFIFSLSPSCPRSTLFILHPILI
jgi:hypothetical protein